MGRPSESVGVSTAPEAGWGSLWGKQNISVWDTRGTCVGGTASPRVYLSPQALSPAWRAGGSLSAGLADRGVGVTRNLLGEPALLLGLHPNLPPSVPLLQVGGGDPCLSVGRGRGAWRQWIWGVIHRGLPRCPQIPFEGRASLEVRTGASQARVSPQEAPATPTICSSLELPPQTPKPPTPGQRDTGSPRPGLASVTSSQSPSDPPCSGTGSGSAVNLGAAWEDLSSCPRGPPGSYY